MADKDNNYKEWIKQNENKWIAGGIITGSIAIITPVIIYFASSSNLSASSFAKLGTVGDFMGGTTVGLLSLTSILFLVSTLVMQRKELGMQREELQLTRDELAKANKQYEITNDTMLKQQFETTFFNMINMHSDLVNKLNLEEGKVKGTDVFVKLNSAINKAFETDGLNQFLLDIIYYYRKDLFELIEIIARMNSGDESYTISRENKSVDELIKKFKLLLEYGIYEDTYEDKDASGIIGGYDKLLTKLNNQGNTNTLLSKFDNEYLKTTHYKGYAYNITMKASNYILENYFISFQALINAINDAPFDEKSKKTYFSILYIKFSMSEINILLYEAIINHNRFVTEFLKGYLSFNTNMKLLENVLVGNSNVHKYFEEFLELNPLK